ncbi:MAG: HAMP domain-containing histidine kinase [Chloroflexi bacterium]|nr:HAMP domain-containing histidine kinase [Chloroflexota bacterium]
MSIQNRLLFVYTTIFMVAFFLFATIVYFLPISRIRAEVDADLDALATELQNNKPVLDEDGTVRFAIDQDLDTLETASTFFLFVDDKGAIGLRSRNLAGFTGLLDAAGPGERKTYNDISHAGASLRVLTVPIYDNSNSQPVLIGYLQVARLFNSVESFSRFLVIALFMGFAGATASVFLAVLLTPSSFKPLEDMAEVARQITNADDLSRRVPYTERGDEIGVLARAFNQLLERLEQLFQTQQRLLADVSHELRTPLTAIRGNADLMRRMGEADDESLLIIQEEAERMTRLVGDLLLLARADAGGIPLDRKEVELDALFFEVYRQVNLMEKSVAVHVTEIDQICVLGDADRLKQLMWNLVGNAIKYTPDGGHVNLALFKTNGWGTMRVEDSGMGIPPENLPYIFDRFYRVDKARNRTQGGSGLGLSIAKWVAEAHGGHIHVTSEVGVGTTFIVTLPTLAEKVDEDDERESDVTTTRPGLRALSVPFRRS